MSEKAEHEIIELLWSISEKLDKILFAILEPEPKSDDTGSQMSISTKE
jgi:hypothetical protein